MSGRVKKGVTNPYEGAGIINVTAALNPQTLKLFDVKRSIYNVALKPEAQLNIKEHYPLVWLSSDLDHQIPNLDPGATRPVQIVATLNGLLSRHMEENAEASITTTREAYLERARILDRLNFGGISMGTVNLKDFEGARNTLENSNFMLASSVQGIRSITHASEENLEFGDQVILSIPEPKPNGVDQPFTMPKPVDFRREEADRYIPHLVRWDPMQDLKTYTRRAYNEVVDDVYMQAIDDVDDDDDGDDRIVHLPEPLLAALETAKYYMAKDSEGRNPAGLPNSLECLVHAALHLDVFNFESTEQQNTVEEVLRVLVEVYEDALEETGDDERPNTDKLYKFGTAMLAFQSLQYCSERRVIGMAVNSNPLDGSADVILR